MLREVSIFALKLNFELHLMIIAVKYSDGIQPKKSHFRFQRSKMVYKDPNMPKNVQDMAEIVKQAKLHYNCFILVHFEHIMSKVTYFG